MTPALAKALEPFLALARAVTDEGSPDFVEWVRESKDWMVVFSFAGHSINLGDFRALAAAASNHPGVGAQHRDEHENPTNGGAE